MRNLLRLLAATLILAALACAETPEDRQAVNPSDSVVLVMTASGNGSGVIIDARHILTDAHVVWPFIEAGIQLPDGTIAAATVIGFDRYVDLALLELPESIASDLTPVTIATEVELGQTVTHLGYSHTSDGSLASDARAGTLIDQQSIGDFEVTLLETNAEVIPGFSGGALVNGAGELVGITQFLLVPGRIFALSAVDAIERAADLIELAETQGAPVGHRLEAATATTTFSLNGPRAHAAFLATSAEQFDLSLSAISGGAITLAVLDVHGHVVSDTLRTGRGELHITATIPANTARLAVVGLRHGDHAFVRIESPVPLQRLLDEDHGQPAIPDGLTFAVLDYPSDIDMFELQLPAQGTVLARVTSLTFDTVLHVELVTPEGAILIASNDDGGTGLFGTNSLLQFTAPVAGTYRLTVSDAGGSIGHAGGYALLISSPFVEPQ
ncbi:MAG: trypsin-like serine protease [Dehalococcoidia bacterium]|nr:trypsin-like serine protease [Dehalococcoidia bacterium]